MKDFFLNLFKSSPMMPEAYTGANLDTRPPEAKTNDIHFQEVVVNANPVIWTTKTSYRQFPVLNQNGTYECGAFSGRKALGVMYSTYPQYGQYVDFSSSQIYQTRSGTAGMSLDEIISAWKQGVTLQGLVNDNPRTDADTNSLIIPQWMRGVGVTFAVSNGVYLPNDIDTIASVIQTTGKAVILLTYFLASEWSQTTPIRITGALSPDAPTTLRHFVTAVDFGLVNGVKTLVIEDSAWFGGINRRFITEDWVMNRVIQAGYPMNFKFMPVAGNRPTYDGQTIVSLQTCLQYDGEFPLNVATIESFGPITRAAVAKFQAKYALSVSSALDSATRDKVHQLFP